MNSVKRRRIESNASTLSKPFRSPLRVNSSAQKSAPKTKPSITDSQSSLSLSPRASKPSVSIDQTPSETLHAVIDHDLVQLQKEHAAVKLELRKLREDLDAAEQALKIHDTRQDEKLQGLVSKWRAVAQNSADDVFTVTSTRVKEMGGLQAWHRSSRRGHCEDTKDDSEEGDVSSEVSTGKLRPADATQQYFTMEVMLQQFGIDSVLLGYDVQNDQWASLD